MGESYSGERRTPYHPNGTGLSMDVRPTTEQLTGAVEYSTTYAKE